MSFDLFLLSEFPINSVNCNFPSTEPVLSGYPVGHLVVNNETMVGKANLFQKIDLSCPSKWSQCAMVVDERFWAKISLYSKAVLLFRRPRQFVMEPSPPSTSRLPSSLHGILFFGAMSNELFEKNENTITSIVLVHCTMFESVYPSVSTFAYVELSQLSLNLCWAIC